MRASEPDGGPGREGKRQTERERDRTEYSWYVVEPQGIVPFGAAAVSKTVFKGLLDETLCNLLGCIPAEQYRFSLLHLRTIIVYMTVF